MKKLLFAATILTMALSGFAQGTIWFANTDYSKIFYADPVGINPPVPVGPENLPGGGPLVVGLFWGSSASTVTTLGATASMGSGGYFGGNEGLPLGTVQVPGTNPGDTDWFAVVAWDSSYGTTYAAEEACRLAGGPWGSMGGPLQFTLNPTQGLGTDIFYLGEGYPPTGTFRGMVLNITPEPSTIGLGCMGAAALLLLRRRK